jgi:hypothetical protein
MSFTLLNFSKNKILNIIFSNINILKIIVISECDINDASWVLNSTISYMALMLLHFDSFIFVGFFILIFFYNYFFIFIY